LNITSDSIEVINNPAASRFEVQLGDGKLAQLIYRMEGDRIIMVHTEVPDEFGGRGIAGKMAHAALEYAKAQQYSVVAQCPYVKAYIERHPEYQSITIDDAG
jgi:predicted GNAT family acetyltransferase